VGARFGGRGQETTRRRGARVLQGCGQGFRGRGWLVLLRRGPTIRRAGSPDVPRDRATRPLVTEGLPGPSIGLSRSTCRRRAARCFPCGAGRPSRAQLCPGTGGGARGRHHRRGTALGRVPAYLIPDWSPMGRMPAPGGWGGPALGRGPPWGGVWREAFSGRFVGETHLLPLALFTDSGAFSTVGGFGRPPFAVAARGGGSPGDRWGGPRGCFGPG